MAATTTLSTVTLLANISASDNQISVSSTSGLVPGVRFFIDGELLGYLSLGPSTLVNVKRGLDGTQTQPHGSNATVYIGRADQFFQSDPHGVPPNPEPVTPYINATGNRLWVAQGDEVGSGAGARWWQQVTTTYGAGALGVRSTTTAP